MRALLALLLSGCFVYEEPPCPGTSAVNAGAGGVEVQFVEIDADAGAEQRIWTGVGKAE